MRRQRRRLSRQRPVPALTDDLLEEIFVRVGSPADLARASTACVAFRRLIADPSFLRRYRSLHPPLLLGLIDPDSHKFEPAKAPHPSAALGRAVARAADFKFNGYLPRGSNCSCYVFDVREGRVLLMSGPVDKKILPDLRVCDPLARRCVLLPDIPDDLLASARVQNEGLGEIGAYLVPSGDEDGDTSFRVIAVMEFTQMTAFIFSSTTGQWSAGPSVSFVSLVHQPWYAYGCFYWESDFEDKLLKLDTSSMELSVVDVPTGPEWNTNTIIVVEAGEGRLRVFSLINDGTSMGSGFITHIGRNMFDKLKMDSVIPLPVGYSFRIRGSREGHIFMLGYRSNGTADVACFTLEIKTLKIQRVRRRSHGFYMYFGFPPSMSESRI